MRVWSSTSLITLNKNRVSNLTFFPPIRIFRITDPRFVKNNRDLKLCIATESSNKQKRDTRLTDPNDDAKIAVIIYNLATEI